jgi:hypothetical protein
MAGVKGKGGKKGCGGKAKDHMGHVRVAGIKLSGDIP